MSASASRAGLSQDVRQLREDGFTHQEIADVLGISRGYVRDLIYDPDGSRARARKSGYRRPCPECGTLMDGSDGRTNGPKLCGVCARRKQHEARYWTPERVLDAFARFVEENGRKPLSHEWLKRLHGDYPYTSEVLREFGSWNAALTAAGLPAEPPGKYVRTPETRARMSAAQRARRPRMDTAEVRVRLHRGQHDRLRALGGPVAAHVRAAVDAYLDGR